MEADEESQSPLISLFSVDLQIPSELVWRAVGRVVPNGEKTHKQEIRKPKQSELMVKELWRVFLTILFPKSFHVIPCLPFRV